MRSVNVVRRFGVLLVVIGFLGLLVWAGLHSVRSRRVKMQEALNRQLTVTREQKASDGPDSFQPDAQGASLKGTAAPAFTLIDAKGRKVSLADFRGRPVIVNFWATWCGPCKLEMPWFETLYQKYSNDKLVILGLSQDTGTSSAEIMAAAKKTGVTYPILLPDEKVSKLYGGVDYLPETFYIDAKGRIVETSAGAPTKDEIEANIKKTIAAGV